MNRLERFHQEAKQGEKAVRAAFDFLENSQSTPKPLFVKVPGSVLLPSGTYAAALTDQDIRLTPGRCAPSGDWRQDRVEIQGEGGIWRELSSPLAARVCAWLLEEGETGET